MLTVISLSSFLLLPFVALTCFALGRLKKKSEMSLSKHVCLRIADIDMLPISNTIAVLFCNAFETTLAVQGL